MPEMDANKTPIDDKLLKEIKKASQVRLSKDDILEIERYIKRIETGIEIEALTHWGNHCEYSKGW
jgi:phosphoribosylformylglycinamidine (FGAM) synthase-like enzyme